MILLFSCFLKKEKERKYWVHPILKYREDGEFLLIKEQRDYHGWFKVYFRTSVAQFDALLAILEPHIKTKTTNFCELCARIYIQCFVLRDEVDELDNRHSGFWRSLLRWLWTIKTPLKMLATDAKSTKNRTRSEFFYDGRKFRRQCVNVIDITWGRIYFSTCENFGLSVQWPLENKYAIDRGSNVCCFVFLNKAAVRKFCLFVAISVENLVLQPGAELSLLRGLYSGTASARMNLMFWGKCVAVSHHTGVNQTLNNHRLAYVLEYMTQIRIFTVYCHLNK